jgi:hypothetical protein
MSDSIPKARQTARGNARIDGKFMCGPTCRRGAGKSRCDVGDIGHVRLSSRS